ncbi:LOW QUALITY PROTEIN: putative glutamate receptor [Vespula maculifrons]|uniref:Glutamate receptor n=1 Tax=Vespula maculifrons TaxID=7453 RepID=A0ABD2CWA2_VESMC
MIIESLYERRHNLHGLIMKAVAVKGSLYTNKRIVNHEILRKVCVTLNFSLNIVSKAKEYKRWNSDEKLGLEQFTRLNAVDFMHPVFNIKNFFVIRKPEKFGLNSHLIFKYDNLQSNFLLYSSACTFTNTVWIAIFGEIIASILLIFLKLIFFSGGSLFSIANFFIFLLVTVLSAAYSAGLISLSTSFSLILLFNALENFVAKDTHRFTVIRGTNSADLLSMNVMKLMLEEEKFPLNVQEGSKNVS